MNKSNSSGTDQSLKIKNKSHDYKYIYKLNDITKKKAKDINSKNKNKSIIINNMNNFSNIKRKINFIAHRDKRYYIKN